MGSSINFIFRSERVNMDYKNKRILKKWGHEEEILRTKSSSVWLLRINDFHSTSMHSHSLKKTGLVCLYGAVKVCFLNDCFTLTRSQKIIIRHAVFHQSHAVTEDGCFLLEVESPINKKNIIHKPVWSAP